MNDFKPIPDHGKLDVNDYASVGEYVYAEIRRQIISWQLKPGQRLSEAEMSKSLGVSRTPVREGFLRLKSEGLVEILSQRGTIISKIDIKKVTESVFVRNCLEREVLREVAGKMSEEQIKTANKYLKKQDEALKDKDYIKFHKYDVLFHQLFFLVAEKDYTWEFLYIIDSHYDRVRMLTLLDYDKFKLLLDEHTELLRLVVEGEHEALAEQLSIHINYIFKELEILKKQYEEYFTLD